jgi:hypothetical protein
MKCACLYSHWVVVVLIVDSKTPNWIVAAAVYIMAWRLRSIKFAYAYSYQVVVVITVYTRIFG